MSVETKHPDYIKFMPIWEKQRDAVDGTNAIKDKTTRYLPALNGHYKDDKSTLNDKYYVYLNYAQWFGATGRTVDGLVGLVFRKEPLIAVNEKQGSLEESLVNDFTLANDTLSSFSKEILTEIITVGRVGILIDLPNVEANELTIKEMEDSNIRPYTKIYKTESITNWNSEIIDGVKTTTLVVLKEETSYSDIDDEFNINVEVNYRVLDLIGDEGVIKYRQRIFSDNGKDGYKVTQEFYPQVKGKSLNYIPFYSITSNGENFSPEYSVINDLADVNIGYYRNSANFENGLIWTGNPTPWVSGLQGENSGKLELGSTKAIVLMQGGGAGFMEFTGQGLKPITESMEEKKNLMAILGARILAADKKTAETAETANIHRAGEQGVLASIANTVSEVLTKALQKEISWVSDIEKKDFSIELNTDYLPNYISPEEMVTLLQMYQGGAISMPVLRWNLKKGEVIPIKITDEILDEQIKDNPPIEDSPNY